MATMNVLDSAGSTVAIEKPLTPGRAAAASSRPVALSAEDFAVIDGIEALIGTTNTTLTTIDGRVDGLETLVGTTNTTLTAIDGRVDGLETLVTSSNTKLDTLNTTVTDATIPLVAHGDADSGDPLKIGYKAIAHGANPTAVDVADRTNSYANRHGIPWVIGGHPNIITRSATIDDADGAQTNASLLTVSAGSKIVITAISAIFYSSTAAQACAVRIGFAAASLAAASEAGAASILLEGKFISGGGNQKGNGAGIIGIGADDEDLRITCDDPVGGSLFVTFSYYTIES